MKKLVLHHVSLMVGYVGVGKSITLPYDGKFGKVRKFCCTMISLLCTAFASTGLKRRIKMEGLKYVIISE